MSKVSLNELMGKGGEKAKGRKLGLNDLQELLGDRMIKIEHTPVGRLRLTQALRKRFGDDYKQILGVSDILEDFDREADFAVKLEKMKMLRAGKGKD